MKEKFKNSKIAGIITLLIVYLIAFVGAYFSFEYIPIKNLILRFLVADVIATVIIYFFSLIFNNSSVYDPYWSVAPMVMVPYFIHHTCGYNLYSIVVLLLICIWGIRLTLNCLKRFKNISSSDWRYTMFQNKHPKLWFFITLTGIHLMPTLIVFLAMLPVFSYLNGINIATGINLGGFVLSILICLFAIIIETIADLQMDKFKKDKNNAGKIIRVGLWKNSRHPNYFGEILFWVSLFLFSLTPIYPANINGGIWVLVFCPLVMFLLFAFISIPMMEKRQKQSKPGYEQYKKETNLLLPFWPPYIDKK